MRCVFVGTGAYLGRIESETRVAFWTEDPVEHGFDQSRLITLDLGMTPNAAVGGSISWDAIQVDDCITGPNGVGGTTLGPRWPEIQTSGAAYLEQRFIATLPRGLQPPCPAKHLHGRAYEHTSLLYWPHVADPRASKRYAGHHAHIIDERGGLARVLVYPPGTSDVTGAHPHKLWIDLADPEQCDAGPDQLTQIGVGSGAKSGALFLISGILQTDNDI